jgi:signal transduction histidine kinase/CheY-like chemotaxis protein
MNLFKLKFRKIQGVAQNKITLAFKDADLERRFFSYYTDRNLVHGRVCHLLAVFFYGIFGIFDPTLFPDAKQAMWFIRYAVVLPVFVAGFIYSYTESYKKSWQLLFAGYVLVTGGGYVYMTAIAPPAISHFLYTGIIFCLFFGYAFIRLRVIHSTWSAWSITLGYIAVVNWAPETPDAIILNSIPYIIGLNLLGMFIGYSIELTARHNFLLIDNLRATKRALRESRDLLEKKVQERTKELEKANRSMVADRKEKRKLEEQFRQAQKMEAVGRLAGGVAHDFNNLMSIVIGYSEVGLMKIRPDDPLRKNLEEIKKAGESAAAVTHQLLAFSRKQIFQVKVFSLNEVITGVDTMLRRLIGEDIEIKALLSLDLAPIEADPGQMEQVLMNLVVNARDAMPQGGRLIIQTDNVESDEVRVREVEMESGAYVKLSVSDTGSGIDADTRERIFEPFFTTKAKGRGTGLGLATVYGIVKQTGGYIWVDSEPGQGTTFNLYFPAASAPTASEKETPKNNENIQGDETLLLVEDDAPLLELAQTSLEHYGYRVLKAASGAAALAIAKREGRSIALVITDVVMPGMNGREMVRQMRSLRTELKVLYMSGYTDDVIADHGILEAGVNFIEKPFTTKALARKVRKMLDGG